MDIAEQLLEVLREHAERDSGYINPSFLNEINSAIYDYYKLEDDLVDEWVRDMWER